MNKKIISFSGQYPQRRQSAQDCADFFASLGSPQLHLRRQSEQTCADFFEDLETRTDQPTQLTEEWDKLLADLNSAQAREMEEETLNPAKRPKTTSNPPAEAGAAAAPNTSMCPLMIELQEKLTQLDSPTSTYIADGFSSKMLYKSAAKKLGLTLEQFTAIASSAGNEHSMIENNEKALVNITNNSKVFIGPIAYLLASGITFTNISRKIFLNVLKTIRENLISICDMGRKPGNGHSKDPSKMGVCINPKHYQPDTTPPPHFE
jgi:hypothetical protein